MITFLDFLIKHKIKFLSVFLVFFFLRSCVKSTEIKKQDKKITQLETTIDSLNHVIKTKNDTITLIPEWIRLAKWSVHNEYDYVISEMNRGSQMMWFHSIVINNKKELEIK